jgi:hypothetical protein
VASRPLGLAGGLGALFYLDAEATDASRLLGRSLRERAKEAEERQRLRIEEARHGERTAGARDA